MITAKAQKGVSLTFYQHFDLYQETIYEYDHNYTSKRKISNHYRFNAFKPGVGIGWNLNEKWRNEIQISYSGTYPMKHNEIVGFGNPDDRLNIFVSAGYELNRLIGTNNYGVSYIIGLRNTLYHNALYYLPPFRNYRTYETDSGLLVSFLAKIRCPILEKFHMELGILVNLFDFRYHRFKVDSPQIPAKDQWIENEVKFIVLPRTFSLNLGMCYSF